MGAGRSICEEFYSQSADPWGFRTRWYEQRKRHIVVASLTRRNFDNAWELGCSVGELTAALAPHCARLLATDGNARAVEEARRRVREFPQVRVAHQIHPEDWPDEEFDLIVFSELGYNFDAHTLCAIADRFRETLTPDGTFIACHWRYDIEGCALNGDQVHVLLDDRLELPRLVHHAESDFLLQIWSGDARSVAAQEGML